MARNSSRTRNAAPPAAHPCATGDELKITLGTRLRSKAVGETELVVWSPSMTKNGHMMILGDSGAGKTHRVRVLCNSIVQCAEAELIVVDAHGDIEIDQEVRVRFNEQSPFGLNPLAVDPDPEAGGVRVQAEIFLDNLEASSRSFGDKQRSLCRKLLEDFYELNGFDRFDPDTWVETEDRPQPSLSGFLEYARDYARREQLKLNEPAYKNLDELRKKMRRFKGIAQGKTNTDIDKAADEARQAFHAHIDDIIEGRADHIILEQYNPDVFASVVDRIATLEATGLYKPVAPPFGESRVKVYDISKVRDREQRMFGETLMEQLLRQKKLRGESPYPHTFVVIDEAHRYFNDDPNAAMSRIMREIRKYGVSVILASQTLADFPLAVISNCATKFILGLDPLQSKIASSKLQIDVKLLNDIRSRTTAIVQLAVVGGNRPDFTPIVLPYAVKQLQAAAGMGEAHGADLREAAA